MALPKIPLIPKTKKTLTGAYTWRTPALKSPRSASSRPCFCATTPLLLRLRPDHVRRRRQRTFLASMRQKKLVHAKMGRRILGSIKRLYSFNFFAFFAYIFAYTIWAMWSNVVKNPIGNFGSYKLTWNTPISQIICVNLQKSLAKKFF